MSNYLHVPHIPLDQTDVLLVYFNPLSPHDALKHHFASLKNDLNQA